MPGTGLILLGHGSRDPRWAEPLERLRARLAVRAPDLGLELAFLEFMQPDLATAARRLAEDACTAITILPVFLGQGGHVREDLPRLAAAVQQAHPGVAVRLARSVGESPAVLDAMATLCLHEAGCAN